MSEEPLDEEEVVDGIVEDGKDKWEVLSNEDNTEVMFENENIVEVKDEEKNADYREDEDEDEVELNDMEKNENRKVEDEVPGGSGANPGGMCSGAERHEA